MPARKSAKKEQLPSLEMEIAAEAATVQYGKRRLARRSTYILEAADRSVLLDPNRLELDSLEVDFGGLALAALDISSTPASFTSPTPSPAVYMTFDDSARLVKAFERAGLTTVHAVFRFDMVCSIVDFFTAPDHRGEWFRKTGEASLNGDNTAAYVNANVGISPTDPVSSAATILQRMSLTQGETTAISEAYQRSTNLIGARLRLHDGKQASGDNGAGSMASLLTFEDLSAIMAESSSAKTGTGEHEQTHGQSIAQSLFPLINREVQSIASKHCRDKNTDCMDVRIMLGTAALLMARAVLLRFLDTLLRLRVEHHRTLSETSTVYCGRSAANKASREPSRCFVCPIGTHSKTGPCVSGWTTNNLTQLSMGMTSKAQLTVLYDMIRTCYHKISLASQLCEATVLRVEDGDALAAVATLILEDLCQNHGVPGIRAAIRGDIIEDTDDDSTGESSDSFVVPDDHIETIADDSNKRRRTGRVAAKPVVADCSDDDSPKQKEKSKTKSNKPHSKRRIASSDSDQEIQPASKRTRKDGM